MAGIERNEFDVIIVGSGPAGISTALHLVKLEPSMRDGVLVLEKETHPRKKICGGAVTSYADIWLERMGIKMSIPFLELHRIRHVIDEEDHAEYNVLTDGGPRMVVREAFDEALVREARKRGVAVSENEPVRSFRSDEDRVFVATPRRALKARILVGADGAKSLVRRTIHETAGRKSAGTTASSLRFLTRVDRLGNPEHRNLECVLDFSYPFQHGVCGYLWSAPFMVGNEAWLNTGIVRFHSAKSQVSSLSDIFVGFLWEKKRLPADPKQFEAHPIRCFHLSSVFSSQRILLVGDAAGVDPLCGEGISFCLGYGEVAAKAIRRALESEDFSFTLYKAEVLEHEIGQVLKDRLILAEGIYGSQTQGNRRDFLRSVLLQGYRTTREG